MLPEEYYINSMTNFEELILLCLDGMGDEGYPAIICKVVNQIRRTKTAEGGIRSVINRLIRLRFAEDIGTPTGRGIRKMRITSKGKEVLALAEKRRNCILGACDKVLYDTVENKTLEGNERSRVSPSFAVSRTF